MPPNRKAKLETEIKNLKILIAFHEKWKDQIWKGRETEYQEQLNAMLDYYNHLRKELNSLNKNSNDNDGINKK